MLGYDELPDALRPSGEIASLLDVGPGIQPQSLLDATRLVAVEAHRPYCERLRENGYPGVIINATWAETLPQFLDDEFDAVVSIEMIEHLYKDNGYALLQECQRVARYALVFCPHGWLDQSADVWDMGGDEWQTHHSAWEPEDFPDGWRTELHRDANLNGVGAIWAAWERP